MFGRTARSPWEQLRGGLVLGSEDLYNRVQALIREKPGLEEARWARTEEAATVQRRVRQLVETIEDRRIKIWARSRVGGERGTALAREFGYRSGAGVTLVVRRIEAAARTDRKLRTSLERIKTNAL
jgi:hypothetical protein